jgi:acyl-coenzyme A thioesterase PaaI-like protein
MVSNGEGTSGEAIPLTTPTTFLRVDAQEALATAMRALITATVEAVAPTEFLFGLVTRVNALVDELAPYVPDATGAPRSRYVGSSDLSKDASMLAARMPYDMIIGAFTPISPPMTIEVDPPKALGRATFSSQFQGAPGCVHGAALAGAFDIVLTAANIIAGAAGPTLSLAVTFKHPTLINEPATFEAWVTHTEGRRTFSRGQLFQAGVVTVEAEGVFLAVGPSTVNAMHKRRERNA